MFDFELSAASCANVTLWISLARKGYVYENWENSENNRAGNKSPPKINAKKRKNKLPQLLPPHPPRGREVGQKVKR